MLQVSKTIYFDYFLSFIPVVLLLLKIDLIIKFKA